MVVKNRAVSQKTKTQYRDNILRKLCRDRHRAIEVVNAITGSNYDTSAKVGLHELESSLLWRYNDIAISIDDQLLVMIEHQSRINPNMPTRLLSYFVDVLNAEFVRTEQLYPNRIHKIPTPHFFVLYNGPEPLEQSVLSLSDAFKTTASSNSLELVVQVIDMNYLTGSAILEKSASLKGYAYLIEQIRIKMQAGQSRDQAIASAVQQCIETEILKEFLENNYEAVVEMLNREYDQEVEHRVIREEAKAEGISIGIEQGETTKAIEVAKNLLNKGLLDDEIAEITGLAIAEIRRLT